MLNDLIEKRKKILAESEQHKNRRNELNALASKYARERNELNAQTREYVEEAQRHKEERDRINKEVQALKEERNGYNERANALFEEIEAFKKEHGNLQNGASGTAEADQHLEFKQQTGFGTDKERELIEKIKHLKALVKEQEAELEQNKEMRAKLAEARELRRRASEIHKEVTEKAELAQQHHDLMVESYRKVTNLVRRPTAPTSSSSRPRRRRTRSTGCLLPARRNSAITIRLYPVCVRRPERPRSQESRKPSGKRQNASSSSSATAKRSQPTTCSYCSVQNLSNTFFCALIII